MMTEVLSLLALPDGWLTAWNGYIKSWDANTINLTRYKI